MYYFSYIRADFLLHFPFKGQKQYNALILWKWISQPCAFSYSRSGRETSTGYKHYYPGVRIYLILFCFEKGLHSRTE
jgi:hypothetical protein